MHDWWLGLVASICGKIIAEPAALVDYRQHGTNTLGAKGFFHGLNPFTNWVAGWRRGNAEYRSLFIQAQALERHSVVRESASEAQNQLLSQFLALPSLAPGSRLKAAMRLGLRHQGGLLWLVAMLRIAITAVDLPRNVDPPVL